MKNTFVVTLSIIIVCLIGQIIIMDEKIKEQNETIKIDDQLIVKHERELELYGDFFVAVIKGDDREERLMREETLEAGAKMTEIGKEIKELINQRDNK